MLLVFPVLHCVCLNEWLNRVETAASVSTLVFSFCSSQSLKVCVMFSKSCTDFVRACEPLSVLMCAAKRDVVVPLISAS